MNDIRLPNELNRMFGAKLREGEKRAGRGGVGSEIAPHCVQRDARQLGVLGGDSLFAAVVAALLTHVVRALHGLTLRTLLNGDRRGTFPGLAKALALLGGTAFGYCHGTAALR